MAEENKSHRASGTTDAQNKFESSKTHARKAAEDDAEQYVRENPTKAIFTALGVGFVLGLIFRR